MADPSQMSDQEIISFLNNKLGSQGGSTLPRDPSRPIVTRIGPQGATAEVPEAQADVQEAKDVRALDVKRDILRKDLESFFAIDESIPRGQGLKRIPEGLTSMVQGFAQDTPRGVAVAAHDAAKKRLRVQLVRAAGDVGNINVVEQKAAEKMIPDLFDSEQTAEVKRAFIRDISRAISSNDPSQVKGLINQFQETGLANERSTIPKRQPDNIGRAGEFSGMSDEELRRIAGL